MRRASGDKFGPIASEWTEDLGEWVYARSCKQRRWFVADGGEYLEYTATIEPVGEVTRVTIRIEINASKPIVWLGIRLGMVSRTIDKLIAAQIALIEAEISRPTASDDERLDPIAHLPYDPPKLDERAARRLPEARRILARLSGEEELSDRLVDFLARAPEDFLGRIRPLELARGWRADPDRVADLFLAAHNAGLVSLRWEILCPRCRNSSTPSLTLDYLPTELHCTTCNVDCERDFSHNVELLFSLDPGCGHCSRALPACWGRPPRSISSSSVMSRRASNQSLIRRSAPGIIASARHNWMGGMRFNSMTPRRSSKSLPWTAAFKSGLQARLVKLSSRTTAPAA